MRLDCCCIDCNDAFRWAETQGGPPKLKPTSDSWYFENDLQFIKGYDKIGFYRLNEGYPSVRMVTSCCHSTLCCDHPSYQQKFCLTFVDTLVSCQFMHQKIRLCTDDLTEEQKKYLEPKEFELGVNKNFTTCETVASIFDPAEPFQQQFAEGPPPSTTAGRTIQSMIEEKGVTTLNWTPTNGVITPLRA